MSAPPEPLTRDELIALRATRQVALAGRVQQEIPRQEVAGDRDTFGAWLEYQAVRVLLEVLARLPSGIAELVGRGAARLGRRVDRRHSDAARRFLRVAFPGASDAEIEERVLGAYRYFFRLLVDGARFGRSDTGGDVSDRFEIVFPPAAQEVFASGSGVVVVLGHLGNWEAGAAALRSLGVSVGAVAKPPRNRPLSLALQREREARGMVLFPRRGAMKWAPVLVEGGGALCLLLDQRARLKPVLAPFFGRPARCDRSAGILLRRLGVPVVVGGCTWTGSDPPYRMEVRDVIQPEEVAGSTPAEISGRINSVLERMILETPEQYFWLHDRFRDTPEEWPEGEEPPAPGPTTSTPRP